MKNARQKPLLTIVIANYNYGRFIRQAIESVIRQCEEPAWGDDGCIHLPIKECDASVELVVCDAASTDNSVEIIRHYAGDLPPNTHVSQIKRTATDSRSNIYLAWWCSEKDGGQSAAFNKGFTHTEGEWLTWLNADDLLMPGTLLELAKLIKRHPEAQWITGNDLHFDNETKRVVFLSWGPHVVPRFFRKTRAQMYPFGPTTFWQRSLYNEIGPIDESLHYQMDLDYWARLTMAGIRQMRLNHTCWAFRRHGEGKSTGGSNPTVGRQEKKYWVEKTGYRYKAGVMNLWYDLWMFFRILDGSIFVRFLRRWIYCGKTIDEGSLSIQ